MVENGKIESTMLGVEDHGILTFFLSLKFEGSGQGLGGYAMDSYDKAKKRRDETCDWEDIEKGERSDCLRNANASLDALCTLRPDVAAVLRGEAVAVPRSSLEELCEDAPNF